MGYHISVHTKTSVEGQSREIYQNPLATATQLWEYWLQPATDIGLTFFSNRFDDGLEVSGEDLDKLAGDLDKLERYWSEARVGESEHVRYCTIRPDGIREEGTIRLQDHLRIRLGYLREAIRIAHDSNGVLRII